MLKLKQFLFRLFSDPILVCDICSYIRTLGVSIWKVLSIYKFSTITTSIMWESLYLAHVILQFEMLLVVSRDEAAQNVVVFP